MKLTNEQELTCRACGAYVKATLRQCPKKMPTRVMRALRSMVQQFVYGCLTEPEAENAGVAIVDALECHQAEYEADGRAIKRLQEETHKEFEAGVIRDYGKEGK